MGIESLREGIISKARERADEIIRNAEAKAKELITASLKEYERRVKEETEKEYKKLRDSYEKAYSDELLKLNMELLALKNEILRDVKETVVEKLWNVARPARKQSLKNLLKESLNHEVLRDFDKLVVYVVKEDVELIREILVEEDLGKVIEVRLLDDKYLGGLVVESYDGSVLVDNTYLTRIERGLNLIISKLQKTVFKEVGA